MTHTAARHAIDMLLSTGLFEAEPNPRTLAVLKEVCTAEVLPKINTSSVDEFVNSILQ
mgnify:CR=1 FL=1